MKLILLGLIRLYQSTLSRVLPPSCRFYPSCSEYGYRAILLHGPWRGSWLALKRVARCHPFNPGGYDPVPTVDASQDVSPEGFESYRSDNSSHVVCGS
jgi:putative membrane protein insertion efficiency factor